MTTENKPTPKVSRVRRIYRRVSVTLGFAAIAYLLLLYYPQPLFAYSTEFGGFKVYSREPIDQSIEKVLNDAETRLRRSPLYDESVSRRVFLTGGFGMYALLSNKAYRSFANSVPFINNIVVSKTDVPNDLVYVDRTYHNSRSLSGVIAHEVTHLFIRQRYGTINASLMPTWKNEGYCEFVAGDSTISLEEGMRLWRENKSDDASYRYLKYHLMVRHLLEKENMSVDDLFTRNLDEKEVEARTFASLE